MKISLHRTGVVARSVIALSLGLCNVAQAGMQVQQPAEPSPKVAPPSAAIVPKPRPAAGSTPATTSRPEEKTAWSLCIQLINAAALGAASDAERRQALLQHCAP